MSPDAGRAKQAVRFAEMLDADFALMHKTRPAHDVVEVTEVTGRVRGKKAMLGDDVIMTGGTLLANVNALKEHGVEEVWVFATHGMFCGGALERFAASDIEGIVVTDTVPIDPIAKPEKMTVLPVAPLLAETIMNVFADDSVSGDLRRREPVVLGRGPAGAERAERRVDPPLRQTRADRVERVDDDVQQPLVPGGQAWVVGAARPAERRGAVHGRGAPRAGRGVEDQHRGRDLVRDRPEEAGEHMVGAERAPLGRVDRVRRQADAVVRERRTDCLLRVRVVRLRRRRRLVGAGDERGGERAETESSSALAARHAVTSAKTHARSSFMLITVQPSVRARSSAFSAPAV